MGQGRRQRGPALASAGQRPVRRASLRLRRSRPAALGPRGLRLAGPRLQGCLAGRGRRHAVRGGQGPPQPGTLWRPALAGRGRRRAGCGGRGTTTARHPRAPRSGPSGQPRRVSTQSARWQGLWWRPGRQLRTPTEPSPGRRPAVGRPYPGAGAPSRRDGPGA